jgi:integrase
MGVIARGRTLWIRFKDDRGKWVTKSTGYHLGDEGKAQLALAAVEADIASRRSVAPPSGAGRMTLREYIAGWLKTRKGETAADDRGRCENHILPALGDMLLVDVRPRHIRDFVASLAQKKKTGNRRKDGTLVELDEPIAPRTVLHVYGTLRLIFKRALADELILTSPCQLNKDDLPKKRDKDPTWRRTAVFTREEVQTVISASDDLVPEDRRTLYALLFIGAMRFGEAAALAWRDYDAAAKPLGRLVVERSYSSKRRVIKGTKTENPREMPVHPTLASALASWRLGGFQRMTGRSPKLDDLIVPSRQGRPRNVNHMLRRFHEDLERVGLRARRQHDARRTFISIARADGARPDILKWATHGRPATVIDDYTTLPWEVICAEVAKAKIRVLEGEVISMPMAAARNESPVTQLVTAAGGARKDQKPQGVTLMARGGADGTRRRGRSPQDDCSETDVQGSPDVTECRGVAKNCNEPLQDDAVRAACDIGLAALRAELDPEGDRG